MIEEYKKFAFLAVCAGHPVTPSDQVDQAWHQHLTYSRSYWEVFCPQVLQMPLHHEPTQGGQTEHHKFNDWYRKTLQSYEAWFGEAPADIWPDPSLRFGRDLQFRRIKMMLIFVWLVIIALFQLPPLCSRYGDRILKQIRADHPYAATAHTNDPSALQPTELAFLVALVGTTALRGSDFANLRAALGDDGGGGDGGGGDGGGGDGGGGDGGCGGCGGCGG